MATKSKLASGSWAKFNSYILSILVLGAKSCVVGCVLFALLWLDNHLPVLLVFGRWNVQLNDLHHVPLWCITGWAATLRYGRPLRQMVAEEELCQLGLYLLLPYFSLLRVLLGHSWFCDQATRRSHPAVFAAYSSLCFGVLLLHATCYHPHPARSEVVDPLATIDWDEVAKRNARFRARELAGYMLEDIFAHRRSAEPLMQRRILAGLAALYTAAHTGGIASHSASTTVIETDAGKPSTSPSIKSRATGDMQDDLSAMSSSGQHACRSGTATSTPGSQNRGPAGLAAVYTAAHYGRMAPSCGPSEGYRPTAEELPARSLVDSSSAVSTPTTVGMRGIPVGLAPGRTPTLPDKPILPAAPTPASAALTLATASTTPNASIMASGPALSANLRLPFASSPWGSFIASPARRPSVCLPAGIPAVPVPMTTDKQLPAAKPVQMGRKKSTSRGARNDQQSVAVKVSARPHTITAPHALARKSSSIKGKLVGIRTQFGELTNLVKTKKNGNSLTGGSGPMTKSSKANTLDRHSSWKAAAKAVKGGFTRRSNGSTVAK